MSPIQSYEGIDRESSPDWQGWVILDLLAERKNETKEHIAEIKRQLDFDVALFKAENYKLPVDTGI